MKKINFHHPELGLLIIRLAVGVIFLAHGISKFQNTGLISWFDSIGLGSTWFYLVAAIETLGGLAMILGVFTSIAGVLLAAVMVGAVVLVKNQVGLMGPGGYEIDLALFAASIGIAFTGPGALALGKKMCNCKNTHVCAVGGSACHCGDTCNNCNCTECSGRKGVCDNCASCKDSCDGHEKKHS